MEKLLAMSILSSTPAHISGGWTTVVQREKVGEHKSKVERITNHGEEEQRPAKASKNPPKLKRFAPEFDGLNFFETLISY